jgi:predicted membrane protein
MSSKSGSQGRIFWGLFLILIGFLFLLDRMNRLDFWDLFRQYWPAVFIVIGLSILINKEFRNAADGYIFIVIGGLLLLMRMRILDRSLWHYIWPVAIIAAGLWILLRPVFSGRNSGFPKITADDLKISAVLAGMKRRVESLNFKGGTAEAVLGGVEIDFSGASLAEGKATLALTAVLGGIEIRVPRDWQIVLEGTPILGGIEDKTRAVSEQDKKGTLYIKATAVLGGIEIKD